jgi:hypothetical protein
MFVNRCSVQTTDPAQLRERAVENTIDQWGRAYGPNILAADWSDGCAITHGDGKSEVGIVAQKDIDGLVGLTIKLTDGCRFSWEEEHIVEADPMVAAEMSFQLPDEDRIIWTSPPGAKLGLMSMLHEFGHVIGLEHTNAFSVMRSSVMAGLPLGGATRNSGGVHVYLMPDDVHGISAVWGFPHFRQTNVFATSQMLRSGQLTDNDLNPDDGKPYVGVQTRCPGQVLKFFVAGGNLGTQTVNPDLQVYVNPGRQNYFGGTTLGTFSITIQDLSVVAAPVTVTIPPETPRDVPLFIYVQFDPNENLKDDLRPYDNYARSALQLQVPHAGVCGK